MKARDANPRTYCDAVPRRQLDRTSSAAAPASAPSPHTRAACVVQVIQAANHGHQEQFLPAALICAATLTFLVFERVRPGRRLPESPGWYVRAGLLNLAQLALIGLGGLTWNRHFRGHALLEIGGWSSPIAEGASTGSRGPSSSIGGTASGTSPSTAQVQSPLGRSWLDAMRRFCGAQEHPWAKSASPSSPVTASARK